MKAGINSYKTQSSLESGGKKFLYHSLKNLAKESGKNLQRIPFSLRILLENLLRHEDGVTVTKKDIESVLNWNAKAEPDYEIQFMPARVLLQDFTGVPVICDLAAMRAAVKRLGGNPNRINPLQPLELVIDHSVQVDAYGTTQSVNENATIEYGRNEERYQFLRWGQNALKNFRVVPPSTGIVHQVNLEYLSHVAMVSPEKDEKGNHWIYPDTLVGTDSHTTMINGLGVLGWGVGGIEAEAAMLGQPCSMLIPQVVGFKFTGKLPAGTTATDLVLTATQMLRKKGVVGKFVEFFGPGLATLSLADRATIANMAPEYGATCGIFPVDEKTIEYLNLTGRTEKAKYAEAYFKEQGMWYDPAAPVSDYTDVLELDLAKVEPSLAGPARPQDRVNLTTTRQSFRKMVAEGFKNDLSKFSADEITKWTTGITASERGDLPEYSSPHPDAKFGPLGNSAVVKNPDGMSYNLTHGSIVIAAITSCTNTSNPALLMTAGLLAKNAVQRGIDVKPWVKTSLAPGSRVVVDYLQSAGLLHYMEALKFHVVGFGCTTCIGNSGPLPPTISKAITDANLYTASVLSGNRNFEARVHPLVRANFLASPPLVVAYALAGNINIDLTRNPLGYDPAGQPVFLKDIWPTGDEIQSVTTKHVTGAMFSQAYSDVFKGDSRWTSLKVPSGDLYSFDSKSTYIKEPPFVQQVKDTPSPVTDYKNARVLAVFGDSITTDHISPAGNISKNSPAGKYLMELGVKPEDFNSYGARRGNHEVMARGTFANVRIKNLMLPGIEGGVTKHLPDGGQMSIYDAAMLYQKEGVPLVILAGKEYGSGSSRDWAAKGPQLQGVKVVIAESFERIHRSNLVGMGILPLQFTGGQNVTSLGLTGNETFTFTGLGGLTPGMELKVQAQGVGGKPFEFSAKVRIDTPNEIEYFKHGGILPYVLRQIVKNSK